MLNNLSALLSRKDMFEPLGNNVPVEVLKEGENRFVSVLFADVKGFTAMSEKLEAEIVQHLLDQLMLSFSERIERYGGYVDKYEGDKIMAHFGSLAYLEQNSRRAVYAGLELIDVINKFNQIKTSIPELSSLDVDLAIRVGINSGMVATGKVGIKREGDFTIYGDAVNLASRMEENGVPLRVMVPASVKEELDGYFNFTFHGEISVKGKSKPISTWLVDSINHDHIARKLSQSAMIAREVELEQLRSIYHRNQDVIQTNSDHQPIDVIGISAGAGMGKTRLIREFCRNLPQNHILISEVSPVCQSPYASFSILLHSIFGLESDIHADEAKCLITQTMNSLMDLIPFDLVDEYTDTIPYLTYLAGFYTSDSFSSENREELVSHLNMSLLLLFKALALRSAEAGQALVLIFDDLHYCDEASLAAIAYLMKNIQRWQIEEEDSSARIMFILAWRDNYKLGNMIPPQVSLNTIMLKELNQDQIKQFIVQAFPEHSVPEHIQDSIIQNSIGNPLFLEEWIGMLRSQVASGEELDFNNMNVPNNIKSLLLSRLSCFDKNSIRLVQDASIIGMVFQKSILNQLEVILNASSDPGATLQRLLDIDYIEYAQQDNDVTEYAFRHQMLHQAVYDSILTTNKRILHRMIAEIIENTYTDVISQWYFLLADHYMIAKNREKSIHYLNKSEKLACSLFMNKKALYFCDKLLSLSDQEHHQDILLRKAALYLDMGNYLKANDIIDNLDLEIISNLQNRDAFILAKTRILMARDDLNIAREYLEENIPLLTSKTATDKAKMYLIDLHRQLADEPDFITTSNDLLVEFKDLPEMMASIENIIGLYYQNHSNYHQAIEYYDRAIQHAESHKIILRRTFHNKANALNALGKKTEAIANFHLDMNIARFLDDDSGCAQVTLDLGMLFLDMDDLDQVLKMLNESNALAHLTGNTKLQGQINYNFAVYHYKNEDLVQARYYLKKCLSICKKLSDISSISRAHDLLGDILYKEGNLAIAKRVYERNLVIQQRLGDQEGIAHTYGNLGNIAAEEEDWTTAVSFYEKQQQICHECGDIEGEAKVWYNWGILDAECNMTEDAIQKVSNALNLFEKGGFDFYIDIVRDYLDELTKSLE